jgi:type I restriction enzyme, S subunit
MSCPKNWTRTALGDVAEVLSGFAFKSKDFNTDGKGMPMVRIRDVVSGATSTFFFGDFDQRFIVRRGDILVGMDGDFNRSRWASEEALLNQRVCKVSAAEGLDDGYLFHLLPQILQVISDRTPFVTVKHLSAKELKEYEIPLPPLEEQKRIAGILDQAAELCRLRTRALDKLDTLGQAIFHEMFGDMKANTKGWDEIGPLGQFADVASGITKGRKTNGENLREVPYLAVSNVQDQYLKMDVVKTIEATSTEIERYLLKRDDLLLTEGGDPDKLGRGTIWRDELDECIHQNHVFRVRVADGPIRPIFLSWQLGSTRGKSYFLRSAKQTTGIASINKTQLNEFPVLAPTMDLQIKFEKCLENATIEVQRLVRTDRSSQTLFASLQHRAFRGEL